jgi:hypothetical protein
MAGKNTTAVFGIYPNRTSELAELATDINTQANEEGSEERDASRRRRKTPHRAA